MSRKHILPILSILVLLSACTGNETGNGKEINPESVYFDYRVWGDEESGYITVKLQYRVGGPNGRPLVLENPAKVELDGVPIQADSSKMNGPYYEVTVPVKEFAGRHTIVYTGMDTKQYSEEFSFRPFSLKTKIPAEVTRGDWAFELEGLDPKDYVRVMMTDTASFSEGIVRMDTVMAGRITVSRDDLGRLASGPIHFEIAKDDEKRVKNGTKAGGKLSVSYGLKREFILKD